MGIISLKQAEEQLLIKNKYYTAGSSMPEQFIYRSLIQIFPEAVNRYHDPMINMEYDINIPELKTYIEYNGMAFHNTEEKLGRDKIKRLHCEKIGRTFIQIIEDSEVNEILKEIDNTTIVYKINGNSQIKTLINDLIIIIEDIFAMFSLESVDIDYTRSLYEAILLSSKYQYKINYDSSGDIAGKQYVGQVFCEIETFKDNEIKKSRKLTIKKVADTQKRGKLIQDEVDKLTALMFNGNSLSEAGMEEIISIQEKQRQIEDKISAIDRKEKAMEIKLKELEKREKELLRREEIIGEKEEVIDKRQQELNRLAEEELHRELNYRQIIEEEIKEREIQLQLEKETYQKKLDKKYQKRVQQLNKEYDGRHELLDNYCDRRIEVEVEEQTREIKRVANEQVERLQAELSKQKIIAARQLMGSRYGL